MKKIHDIQSCLFKIYTTVAIRLYKKKNERERERERKRRGKGSREETKKEEWQQGGKRGWREMSEKGK